MTSLTQRIDWVQGALIHYYATHKKAMSDEIVKVVLKASGLVKENAVLRSQRDEATAKVGEMARTAARELRRAEEAEAEVQRLKATFAKEES